MDNVKNNFEELGKLLSGALAILEETGITLSNRVLELEKRVEELENKAFVGEVPMKNVDEDITADEIVAVAVDEEETVEVPTVEETTLEEAAFGKITAEETTLGESALKETAFGESALKETNAEDAITPENMTAEETIIRETIVEKTIVGGPIANTIEDEARGVEVIADATIAENVIVGDTGEIVGDVGEDCMSTLADSMDTDFADGTDGGLMQESGADLNSVFEGSSGVQIVNEAAKPDWYDWEVDYPASYVDDVYKGISFNDRYEFIKELFNVSGSLDEAELLFKETLDEINEMENFKKVVAYVRERFPQWDEQSDEVYRFYMAVRRKFNR